MTQQARSRILLVDDRPENLLAMQSVLADLGQDLVTAGSGEEALRHLLHDEFACVLLDVQMPGMDGFEAAQLIRARPRTRLTPILFLTAISKSDQHVSRGYELGAVDYLFKPYDPDALRAKVGVFVELDLRRRELIHEVEQRRKAEEELRRAQDDLREFNAQLEDRVAARTAELETARRRLTLLSEVGAVLVQSLDFRSTFIQLAQLITRSLSETCVLAVLEPDGSLRRIAWHSRDLSANEGPREQSGQFNLDLGLGSWSAQALTSGRSVVEKPPARKALLDLAQEPLLEGVRAAALAVTPLVVRGRTYGLLAATRPSESPGFSPGEIHVLEEVARRAAAAVDNARLLSEVQEAARRKDEFLAMLAHELRNPLASSTYALHSLERLLPDNDSARRLHGIVQRQTRQLTHLVDDLLDVSRISRGRIDLRPVTLRLRDVLARAIETARPMIEDRGQTLVTRGCDEEIYLSADPVRLEQVLVNLLTNAVKYTDRGGVVTVEVSCEAPSSSERGIMHLTVSDTGCGIEAERLPQVFDLFTQLEPGLDRQQGGLGIGLYVARQIVHMHGGGLIAQSEGLGKGSSFTLTLPALPALEATSGEDRGSVTKAESSEGNGRMSVLLVEDNRDAAETLTEIIEDWGHDVAWMQDGPSALSWLGEHRPDCVILDVGLPGMSGHELAEAIRETPELKGLRLIALTGYGRPVDREQSHRSGVDIHLTKPVDPARLKEILSATPRMAEP